MKREIKFRGKRIDNGEWVYGYYLDMPLVYGHRCQMYVEDASNEDIDNTGSMIEVQRETVGQYTGMQDSSKKDIYEDDVYDLFGKKRIVFFEGAFCVTDIKKNSPVPLNWTSEIEDECVPDGFSQHIEIIGNIHDNKTFLL